MLINFDKPNKLNGEKLVAELLAVGIEVNVKTSPRLDGDGSFWLDIDPKKESAAKPIVDLHTGDLAKVVELGLTEDEAKAVIGGN